MSNRLVEAPSTEQGNQKRSIQTRMLRFMQYIIFPVSVILVWYLAVEFEFIHRNVLKSLITVVVIWFDLLTGATQAAWR